MHQISLNTAEVKTFLDYIIKNNRHLQSINKIPVATEIIGDAGLGKTSIAMQVAKENNLNLVKLNLTQIEELGDLVGFPIKQFELQSVNTNSKPKFEKVTMPDGKIMMKKLEGESSNENIWVDENAIDQYLKLGYTFTGQKRMSYCPPEWISGKTGGGILILDDWSRADQRFVQACMELIDRQTYISWSLPKDWHIILTANPDNGEYLVNAMDVAQKTRYISINIKWDHEEWAKWAEKENIDGRAINFVLMNPEIVTPSVNPRSITTFFNCISSIPEFDKQLPLIQMIGEGSVGGEVATLFSMFINNKLDKLVTPQEMLLKHSNDEIKTKLTGCIMNGSEYRADIASVLTTRFINYTVNYANDNSISDDVIKRIGFFIKDDDIFTNDLKYHIVKKIINGNKTKFQKLLIDTQIQALALK